MRNPFGKPDTLWHWWLGSLCWTVAVVAGWLIVSFTLLHELDNLGDRQQQNYWAMRGMLGSLGVAQGLLIRAAWRRPTTYPAIGRANWPALLMLLWRAGLAAWQVAWLGYTTIVVGYGLSGPLHPAAYPVKY